MKKSFIVLFLIFSAATLPLDMAADTAIDFPYYEFNNSHALDIRRVETNSDSVIVYADLYSRPDSWVSIASTAYIKGNQSGKILPIDGCEGLDLDKETFPGNSGRIPFIMKFGALAPEDDSFDFVENDGPGALVVKGINIDMPLTSGNVKCHLEGTVIDPTLSRMIVLESDEDFRTVSHFVSVPVTDGYFVYDFYADKDRYYTLFPFHQYITGSWQTYNFFGYDGPVSFYVAGNNGESDPLKPRVISNHPDQIIATESFARHTAVYNYLDSISDSIGKDNMLTPEGQELFKRINETEGDERKGLIAKFNSGEYYSKEYKNYLALSDSLSQDLSDKDFAEFVDSPSLFALTKVNANLNPYMPEEVRARYAHLYDSILADYRPDYYMHEKIRTQLRSKDLAPGKPYIDYEITDSDGSKVKFSDLAGGKVTLVDLWASWCGPCRRLSKSYIPVYEKFKDNGLTVVSIARESAPALMEQAVKADGYPWKTYLELNDCNHIWEQHGAGNSGGTSFLVDKDGTILLVHPSAEELEKYLDEMKQSGRL